MKALRRPGRRFRELEQEEKGQAGIELMLVFPIFFLFLLLAVDLGLWMYHEVSAANAVREAARFGAVNCAGIPCDEDLIKDRAEDRSHGVLAADDVLVGWTPRDAAAAGQKGSSVVVKVSDDRRYDFLFLPGVSPPIRACADMRLERNETGTIAGELECD